jgi:hypothetical protein
MVDSFGMNKDFSSVNQLMLFQKRLMLGTLPTFLQNS